MKKFFITIILTIAISSCKANKTNIATGSFFDLDESEVVQYVKKENITTQEKKEDEPLAEKQERNSVPILNYKNIETSTINKNKIRVGLFFPFSGKNRDLGFSLYNAAVLSIFDNDVNHNIELVLIDSKDDSFNPTKAIKDIVDQNVKIVIGPVFSSSVEAIEKDLANYSITAISLSNNQQLAGKIKNGGGAFISGFLLEQQIDRIVSFAIENNKINFAILVPNNQYGLTISKIFKSVVSSRDGIIITSEFYDPSGRDLNKVVERIVDASITSKKINKSDKKYVIKDSDKTYPQVIFIPESGKILSKIASLIKEYNKQERQYQIIGTSQWDDRSTFNNKYLIGSWFPAPEHHRFARFEKSYFQTYDKYPPRIASIAYDAVAAIAELVDKNDARIINSQDLVNYKNKERNGFSGIDGTFRFLENGLVQRNFAILKVEDEDFVTIEKPAEKFLNFK